MSVFAAALGAIFRDPNMAVGALFRAGGVPYGGQACRVMRKNPDQAAGFNGAQFVSASCLLDVQASEIPVVEVGDHFLIGAEVLEVMAEPVRDRDRLIWTVQVRARPSDAL